MMELRNKELYGDFYENKNMPLVVIIGGSIAGIPKISNDFLEYLQSKYSVLVLAYFGVGDLPKELVRIPLEYFINAIHYFKDKLQLTDNEVTVIGSSKGGELVLLLISEYIHPHAAIACVPSCYVWQGIPTNMQSILFPKSSWTIGNKEVPFVKFRYSKEIIKDIKNKEYSSCHEKSIVMNKNQQAIIDVNNYHGRLLLLSAETDHYWPSKAMCTLIEKNGNSNMKHVVLNLAGHYFLEYEQSGKEMIAFLNQQS
jgi:uncharacterized protein